MHGPCSKIDENDLGEWVKFNIQGHQEIKIPERIRNTSERIDLWKCEKSILCLTEEKDAVKTDTNIIYVCYYGIRSLRKLPFVG